MVDLQHFVIRYRLGLADTESLVRVADALLAEGHAEPAVIELSISESPIMAEAAPIFERACAQLGVTIPSKDEAINELLRFYVESITSGTRTPHEGLSAMMREVYFPHFANEPCKKFVGDSRGMEHLIGAYWAHDDLIDPSKSCSWNGKYGAEAITSWEQFVRQLAQEWIESHKRIV